MQQKNTDLTEKTSFESEKLPKLFRGLQQFIHSAKDFFSKAFFTNSLYAVNSNLPYNATQSTDKLPILSPKNKKKIMHKTIEKALIALQDANYAGYFEAMDELVPKNLLTPYQEHKNKFISGQYPHHFYQQLEVLAKEVDKQILSIKKNKNTIAKNNNPNLLKDLYEILDKKLNDEDLNLFCMLHFGEVHSNFAQGQNKRTKITNLLDYAKRKDLLDKLESDLKGFQ